MATVNIHGTEFTFAVAEKPKRWDGYSVYVQLTVENEFIHYHSERRCDLGDVEGIVYGIYRLLAGGYRHTHEVPLPNMDAVLLFNPDVETGVEDPTREYLRSRDCKLVWNMLFHSAKEKNTLGGVYVLMIAREALSPFVKALEAELEPYTKECAKRKGKYLFVAVSPQGYKGCHYWYLDPKKKTKAGTFVWVKMGRRKILQLVYVDEVRYFNEENAPCDWSKVKQVERQATQEDIIVAKTIWKE